jgi:response regulator of citrate/malate metabolism
MTNSIQKAKELVESKNYDLAVFDFFLIDGTSSEILNFMHQKHIKLQTLVLSAEEDIKILSSVDHNMNFIGVYNKSNLEFFYKDLYSLL